MSACDAADTPGMVKPTIAGWRPVILLIPARLGLELNPAYLPALHALFQFPQSIGVAGGRLGPALAARLGATVRTYLPGSEYSREAGREGPGKDAALVDMTRPFHLLARDPPRPALCPSRGPP